MEFLEPILTVFSGIKTVLLALIPLGFLIFIHELGHFLAAKRAGIKVNTFSIGFGPKIIGFKRGETEYKLSWLPFGGYVQMEGENPTEQTGAEGEFGSASLRNRTFVVAAGPVVNILFGILAFWFIFTVGVDRHALGLIGGLTGQTFGQKQDGVQIAMVDDDGPAGIAGVMPGDKIVSINDDRISNFSAFQTKIFTNPNKPLELVVQRNENLETLIVVPDAVPNSRGETGKINVVGSTDVLVSDVINGSLAEQAGIKVGDQIKSIDAENLYTVPVFDPGIWQTQADWTLKKYQEYYNKIDQKQNKIKIDILREGKHQTITLPVTWQLRTVVQKKSTADLAGFQDGDILKSVNGKVVDSKSLISVLEKIEDKQKALNLLSSLKSERAKLENTLTAFSKYRSPISEMDSVLEKVEDKQKALNLLSSLKSELEKVEDILIELNKNRSLIIELESELEKVKDTQIEFGILREGTEKTIIINPTEKSDKDKTDTEFGMNWATYLSGMKLDSPLPRYNIFTAFAKGAETSWLTITSIARTLKQLVSGEVSPKYLSGPVGIVDVTSRMFDSVGLASILFFIGFISVNLAIVNLLPIPIADGGHLLFFAVEKILGRPVPRRAQEIVQQVSVVLLIALFLYITWYDGISLFDKWRN